MKITSITIGTQIILQNGVLNYALENIDIDKR